MEGCGYPTCFLYNTWRVNALRARRLADPLLETRAVLWCVEMLDEPLRFLAGFHLPPFGLISEPIGGQYKRRSEPVYAATRARALLIAVIAVYLWPNDSAVALKPFWEALINQSTPLHEPGVTFSLWFGVSLTCQTRKEATCSVSLNKQPSDHWRDLSQPPDPGAHAATLMSQSKRVSHVTLPNLVPSFGDERIIPKNSGWKSV